MRLCVFPDFGQQANQFSSPAGHTQQSLLFTFEPLSDINLPRMDIIFDVQQQKQQQFTGLKAFQ